VKIILVGKKDKSLDLMIVSGCKLVKINPYKGKNIIKNVIIAKKYIKNFLITK
tara:strand:- start:311 stop:469 length:159 start_codon:yes stop_codon:yes gene_type:complete